MQVKRRSEQSRRSGFTLVEVMVAVGLLLCAFVILNQMTSNTRRNMETLEFRYELDAHRRKLLTTIDCLKSLTPYRDQTGVVTCPASLELVDHDDHTIIGTTERALGQGWFGKVACAATGLTVFFEKRLNSQIVELNGSLMDYSASFNPALGGPSVYRLCPEMFNVRPRVASFDELLARSEFASVSVFPGDCPKFSVPDATEMASADPTLNRADRACGNICVGKLFSSGYVTECWGGNVRCTCIR